MIADMAFDHAQNNPHISRLNLSSGFPFLDRYDWNCSVFNHRKPGGPVEVDLVLLINLRFRPSAVSWHTCLLRRPSRPARNRRPVFSCAYEKSCGLALRLLFAAWLVLHSQICRSERTNLQPQSIRVHPLHWVGDGGAEFQQPQGEHSNGSASKKTAGALGDLCTWCRRTAGSPVRPRGNQSDTIDMQPQSLPVCRSFWAECGEGYPSARLMFRCSCQSFGLLHK